MPGPIEDELKALEEAGRISAKDQRPVHRDFGFASLAPSPLKQRAEAPQPKQPGALEVGAKLDDAWSRLKSRIEPS